MNFGLLKQAPACFKAGQPRTGKGYARRHPFDRSRQSSYTSQSRLQSREQNPRLLRADSIPSAALVNRTIKGAVVDPHRLQSQHAGII